MSVPTQTQYLSVSESQRESSATPSPSISRLATPIHDSNGNLLPAILCLHGGGSNATVFKIQSRRIIWNLQGQFRFVFAQAPIEGTPGFGMLPVFASCAPFYRWVERRFKMGEAETEATPAAEVDRLDQILEKIMQENGGVESFVGLMGFSQGARLVPGLLLRHLVLQKTRLGGSPYAFKFGVMIGGPYPPICLHDEPKVEDYELLKGIPTVHAWGRDDHVKPGCEALWKVCEGDECFQMDFEGGHHLPLKDGEARDLCDLIRGAWYAGGGEMVVGGGESY